MRGGEVRTDNRDTTMEGGFLEKSQSWTKSVKWRCEDKTVARNDEWKKCERGELLQGEK